MAWDETEEIVTHRKFGQPSSLDKKREQISFDLATESDLLCRDYANGALLIELIGKVESGSVSQQSQGIMEIFNVVVETDDGERGLVESVPVGRLGARRALGLGRPKL
jgi:hypothetical protein